jgi:ubiquitin C-terminal hydrolase
MSEHQQQQPQGQSQGQPQVIVIENIENNICKEIKKTGLINNGNGCFYNAVMQCLAESKFIHQYLERYYIDDIKIINIINKYKLGKYKANEIEEYITKLLDSEHKHLISDDEKRLLLHISKHSNDIFIYTCFKEIINKLHSKLYKTISCSTLISVAREISEGTGFEHLFNGEQNDPHEFMAYLLDKIHSAKSSKVVIELPANYELLDPYFKLYLMHFKNRYQNDFSMFVKNFYYYILNCIECSKCNHQSLDTSPNDIMCVSLPSNWQTNNHITLEDCIEEMFKVEGIDYKCEKCGNNENNRMDKKLLTKPKTLIIKIKRYAQMGQMLCKINKMIYYPESINLNKYFCGVNIEDYHLYAIINHIGSLGGGHYYSYVKDYSKEKIEDKWYLCNDTQVQELKFENVMSSNNAYILFYQSNN